MQQQQQQQQQYYLLIQKPQVAQVINNVSQPVVQEARSRSTSPAESGTPSVVHHLPLKRTNSSDQSSTSHNAKIQANFSVAEKIMVLTATAIAMDRSRREGHLFMPLNLRVRTDTVTGQIHALTREILQEESFIEEMGSTPRLPSIQSHKALYKTFREKQVIRNNDSRVGRKSMSIRDELQLMIKEGYGIREIHRMNAFGASLTTIQRHVKRLGNVSYNEPEEKYLEPHEYDERMRFCSELKIAVLNGKLNLNDLIFSDVSVITVRCHRSKKRNQCYRLRGERPCMSKYEKAYFGQQMKKIFIFVCFSVNAGKIGPFFIEHQPSTVNDNYNSMTAEIYQALLRDQVIPALKEALKTQEAFDRAWWQQDRSPAHTAPGTIALLREHFGGRIISENTDFAWPARSPDLTAADFWLWGTMEAFVGRDCPKEIEDIKQMIRLFLSQLVTDDFHKAVLEFKKRIDLCMERLGGHFEDKLAVWKTDNRINKVCTLCKNVHRCPCDKCIIICFRQYCCENPDFNPVNIPLYYDECRLAGVDPNDPENSDLDSDDDLKVDSDMQTESQN